MKTNFFDWQFKNRKQISNILMGSFWISLFLVLILSFIHVPVWIGLSLIYAGRILIILDIIHHYGIWRLKYNYEYKKRKAYEEKYGPLEP